MNAWETERLLSYILSVLVDCSSNQLDIQGLANDTWKEVQAGGPAPCNLQVRESSQGFLWDLQVHCVQHYMQEHLSIEMMAEVQS